MSELGVPVPAGAGPAAPGTRVLRVPDDAGSQRVDRFLADVTGLSRSHVQKLISAGHLTSDGVALKANSVIGPGTALRLVVPDAERLDMAPAPEIELRIVYEDADLLIVDKAAGLVVHPSPGHAGGTLVNALLARAEASDFGGIAGVQRPDGGEARFGAALADGPAQGAAGEEDVPRPRPRGGSGRPRPH
jgi:ribosomal 50S subunit-recycling heat shock protein